MGEFFCFICWCLVNVFLLDVDVFFLIRKFEMYEDGKSVDDIEKYWSWFWEFNENLKFVVENFCCLVC